MDKSKKNTIIKFIIPIIIDLSIFLIVNHFSNSVIFPLLVASIVFILLIIYFEKLISIYRYVLTQIRKLKKKFLYIVSIFKLWKPTKLFKGLFFLISLILLIVIIFVTFNTNNQYVKEEPKIFFTSNEIDKLNGCNENQFEKILNEVLEYISKNDEIINESDIDFLKKYFTAIVFFEHNKSYDINFNGFDKKGNPKSLNIYEISELLYPKVLSKLKYKSNKEFIEYIDLVTKIFNTPEINNKLKITLLSSEQEYLTYLLMPKFLPSFINEEKLLKFYQTRIYYLHKFLLSPDSSFMIKEHINQNIENLYKIFYKNVKSILNIFIGYKQYENIYKYLESLLKVLQNKRQIGEMLQLYSNYNNMLLLKSKQEVYNLIATYKKSLELNRIEPLKNSLTISTNNFSIGNLVFQEEDVNFKNVKLDKIKTKISIIVPYKSSKPFFKVENNITSTKIEIEFFELNNLFDDPIFYFLEKFDLNINGLPIQTFSSSVGNETNSTIINLTLNTFVHPNFDIINDTISYKVGEDNNKLSLDLFKNVLIGNLKNVFRTNPDLIPFKINFESINLELIQNILVSYIDENNVTIYDAIYLMTDLKSYLNFRELYINKTKKFNNYNLINNKDEIFGKDFVISNELDKINKLVNEINIINSMSFISFLEQSISIGLKVPIEYRGIKNHFWVDKNYNYPFHTKDIRNLVLALIEPILFRKKIEISNDESLHNKIKINFESLKLSADLLLYNAHDDVIISSLKNEDISIIGNDGSIKIIVIFWFKNNEFNLPKEFESISKMEEKLNQLNKDKNTKLIFINCTL